jgi:hypothetical protein
MCANILRRRVRTVSRATLDCRYSLVENGEVIRLSHTVPVRLTDDRGDGTFVHMLDECSIVAPMEARTDVGGFRTPTAVRSGSQPRCTCSTEHSTMTTDVAGIFTYIRDIRMRASGLLVLSGRVAVFCMAFVSLWHPIGEAYRD